MIYDSPIFAKASGSICGSTFTRSKGGSSVRGRSTPTNKTSTRRDSSRKNFACLQVHWNDSLTQSQRDSWELYGENVATTNRLGNSTYQTGKSWFVANNIVRLSAGQTIAEDGPTTFEQGCTGPIFNITAIPAAVIVIGFNKDYGWNSSLLSGAAFYLAEPMNPGTKRQPSNYRFVSFQNGGDGVPAFNFNILPSEYPFPYTSGQKLHVMVKAIYPDGRIGSASKSNRIFS